MAERVVVTCDRCGTKPRRRFQVTIGGSLLDLCKKCSDSLNLWLNEPVAPTPEEET